MRTEDEEEVTGNEPSWLKREKRKKEPSIDREKIPVRVRATTQEKKLAKILSGGKTTSNSGATFGENDVKSDLLSVECKYTDKKSFSVKIEDWRKCAGRAERNKIPIMQVNIKEEKLCVISLSDLLFLVENNRF